MLTCAIIQSPKSLFTKLKIYNHLIIINIIHSVIKQLIKDLIQVVCYKY